MKHRACLWTASQVAESAAHCAAGLPDGRWVPARPHGWRIGFFKAMWLVWTGRADVLVWEGQP